MRKVITGSLLARNTALNFFGQVVPLIVAVVTIPYVIKGLGAERFGILSLAWVVLGYFSLLDLGLGRATTKFVAEALGEGEFERIPSIVWTSLLFIAVLAIIGAGVLIALTPLLVEDVLNVPLDLINEAKTVFYIMSISILITLITATLSGILEAYQRFDLVNALKISSRIVSLVIPVVAIYFGCGLPVIVLFLAIKDLGMVFVYFLVCMRLMPKGSIFSFNSTFVRLLFNFGGWITAIAVVSSVLVHFNHFLIGSRLSMSDVAYYTAAYQMTNYLWIMPTSLFVTLFPAFSAIGRGRKEDLERVFARSLKHLILLMGPIVLVLVLFAREILHLWLGSEFAARSTLVLQILAVGFFLNSQAWIPSTLFQGIGRPDIVAKLFLIELPLYVGIAWWLIEKMGIEGAALAWALRGGVAAVLFFVICWKVVSLRFCVLAQSGVMRALIAVGGLILTRFLMGLLLHEIWPIHAIATMGLIALFGLTAWRYVLDAVERRELKAAFLLFQKKEGVTK